MTQESAARALGLTRTTYANYESAGSEPDFDTLLSISSFFGASVDDILSRNLEIENYLNKKDVELSGASSSAPVEATPRYEANDAMVSVLADRQETAIWYLLKEVREIREQVDELKKSVKEKDK